MEIKMYHVFSWDLCHCCFSLLEAKKKVTQMPFSLSRNYTLFIICSLIESRLNLFFCLREKATTLYGTWMYAKYSHEFM